MLRRLFIVLLQTYSLAEQIAMTDQSWCSWLFCVSAIGTRRTRSEGINQLWSSNNCYIFWVCVSIVAWVTRHADRSVILSSVGCLALPLLCTLSHKPHDFRGKKLLNMECLFWFSVQSLSAIFLILRRIQRDNIVSTRTFSCRVPDFLSDFNEI